MYVFNYVCSGHGARSPCFSRLLPTASACAVALSTASVPRPPCAEVLVLWELSSSEITNDKRSAGSRRAVQLVKESGALCFALDCGPARLSGAASVGACACSSSCRAPYRLPGAQRHVERMELAAEAVNSPPGVVPKRLCKWEPFSNNLLNSALDSLARIVPPSKTRVHTLCRCGARKGV